MSKELYIAELERIAADLEAAGYPSDVAYEMAGERAYDAMRERLLDRADNLRKRQREDGGAR